MKFSFKRVLSFALVLLMVISLLPTTASFDANAAGTLSTITGLTATWTDASNSNGSASWSASGTGITGTATGYQQVILSRTVTSKLTLKNTSGGEATLSFSYELTNGGSVSGAISGTSGDYSSVLANNASITITLKSPGGASTNTLRITGLSLISTSAANVTTTFKSGTTGGGYTLGGTEVTGTTTKTEAAGTKYQLVAVPDSGYIFFGWYDEISQTYLDYGASYNHTAANNATIVPKFVSTTTALFGVGAAKFDNLTEAGAFAAAGDTKTIILLNNGTVSGSHTIPAGVTLLVPFDVGNTLYTTEPAHTNNYLWDTATWVKPTAYRTLTLAADANITVNGSISVSGKHFAGGGDPKAGGCGVPTGPVGFVQMVSGSQITLNSGANLYAWGYVTGGGTITAKSGSKVYENFMIRDFRGGGATTSIANDGIVFPLSQYYVQNIEVATNYEYGAEEHVYTSLYISGASYSAGVKFIGEGAMFQPQEGAVLTKDYIENKDRLELTVNGNAALANMALSLAGTEIDSSTFILPMNSNITININSGTTTLKQDLALLPGVELNIAQGAVLDLASGTGSGTISDGTGYNLFVYDLDEWSSGYAVDTFDPEDIANSPKSTGLKFVHQTYDFIALNYVPGRTYTRTASDLKDAVINVNGTIITNGFLYTTEGGASIISSEKTGVIAMNSGAGAEAWTYQAGQNDTTPVYYAILCNSAALKNGDGSYVSTADAAAGTTYNYCANHDCWYTDECAKCKTVSITWLGADNADLGTDDYDNGAIPSYRGSTPAKAANGCTTYTFAGWMDTAGNKYPVGTALPAATAEATYTAYFTEGTSHTNIVTDAAVAPDCDSTGLTEGSHCEACGATIVAQTEVPATGNHSYTVEVAGTRVDATCKTTGSVTMQCANCSATQVKTLAIDANNHASADYTYVNNNNGTHTKKHACCSAVVETEGHTYVNGHCDCEAVQTFTVTWVDAAGKAVDSETVTYGGNATKTPAVPAKDGYNGVWSGTATNVTSDVTITPDYTLKSYQISFDTDGDGDVDYSASFNHFSKLAMAAPVLPENTAQYTYAFDCWKDQDGNVVDTNTVVTGEMTVTMFYTTTVNTYTVTWIVDGNTTTESYKYGDVPSFKGSTDKAQVGCTTYTFNGWDNEIVAVTGDVTYTATYTEGVAHVGGTTVKNKVDATCGENGYTGDIHCATCDALLTKGSVDPATGNHNYENGKCTVCGNTLEVKLSGSFNDWNGYAMTWTEGGIYTYTMRLDAGTYEFKINSGNDWFGNSGTIYDVNATPWTMDSGNNCKLVAVGGTYTFTYDLNNNQIKIDAVLDTSAEVYLKGSFNEWTGVAMTNNGNGTYTVTLDLAAGSHTFKVTYVTSAGETWLGKYDNFVDTVADWVMGNEDNSTLVASGGTYTFTFDLLSKNLKVDYAPAKHVHTYGNPVFAWDPYYTSCKVTYTCGNEDGKCEATSLEVGCNVECTVNADNQLVFTATSTYAAADTDTEIATPANSRAIYLYNAAGWTTMNVHYWNDSDGTAWPGVPMTKVGENLYVVVLPVGYDQFIINNKISSSDEGNFQTGDLSIGDLNGANVYNNTNGKWGYNEPSKHTITWNACGKTETTTVYYGATPVCPFDTLDYKNGCAVFTFSKWDQDIVAVTGDATYTAQYTRSNSHVGDTNNDHYCDSEGCKDKLSNCVDANADHKCDYTGCGATMSDCADNNNNHYCDSEGCKDKLSDCIDANADHKCDYTGCGSTMSNCADNDNNHYCDSEGCKDKLSDCIDANADHKCDYTGCGVTMSECADDANDGDHNCDFAGCGKAVADSVCYGGQADCTSGPICEDCGKEHGEALGHGHTEGFDYTDLENGKHSVTCKDCGTVTIESGGHDYTYDTRNHKCQCGAVEEFKLTVVYGPNGEYTYEAMVPYWTRMDSLDEINNIPWTVYVNDATHFGHYDLYDFYWDMDGDGDLDWDRYFLEGYMTDEDMYVEAQYRFTGFAHDGNGWQVMDYGSVYKNQMIILTMADLYENGSEEEIEGVYMGDANGYRIENGMGRWYYLGHNPFSGITYEPNAEDIAYYESKGQTFIDKEMTWYYFGADGKMAENYTGLVGDSYVINGQAAWHIGLVEIDGEYYYFKGDEVNGGNKMVSGGDFYLNRNNSDFNMVAGGIYTFDENGVMQLFHGITESELFEGKRHYIGGRLTPGLGLVDLVTAATGEVRYFYVDSDGQLILDAEYYIGANSFGLAKGIYYFDAEGFLVMPEPEVGKNGFYFEDGAWFYYVDGAKAYCAGLICTTGINWYETADAEGVENQGWVYVKSNGALATGEYYVTNVNNHASIASGDLCVFGADCLLQTEKDGIVAENGGLYYYVNNKLALAAGLIETENGYIYVRSNGQLVVGTKYWITNVNQTGVVQGWYEFDENGIMLNAETEVKNGVVDGYYYVDGKIAYAAGLIEIEPGKFIYVRSNGQLATGLYWTTNHNGELAEGLYDFGEDGYLVVE